MAQGIASYRDLSVWRQSLDWAEAIYEATAHWPRDERFRLISQVRRAAVSIASNIAEGSARRSTGEFIQFLGIAKGSLAEAETQLLLAERLSYLSRADARALLFGVIGHQPYAGRALHITEEARRRLIQPSTNHYALTTGDPGDQS